jgi:hypothetical protein
MFYVHVYIILEKRRTVLNFETLPLRFFKICAKELYFLLFSMRKELTPALSVSISTIQLELVRVG